MDTWRTWFKRPEAHLNALRQLYSMGSTDVPVEQRQMARGENHLRPHLIHFKHCKNILLEDLSDGVKIKQDFMFFDKHYSGVRPLELAVEIKNKNKTVWDYDVMKQLNEVDNYLKKEYHAGFMYSPAMLTKNINKGAAYEKQ